ncbi:NAD(P)-dependent oxidoreductase [Tropicibacter naphthalenivorans]|uniref:2-hydroxy-3-oxopropionate reductase n=1 Tax=Tropicibacter naphthalenivorans TaxID=441103 RepID=A0A0P1GXG8_9RHOB|nr:NAD(P)-dependent oxidoreductase [Tropicibacter naphthalenivorans]CUH81288.1 2-hydroxy-3-oxopropionate reductase [Tropicibacter naphthalenivorans]SMC98218.1 3-hydroxyisobutyrate dehydrogenase [Tropicibacter naphthalenivorans]
MRIGYVGLGVMGGALARRLLVSGPVTVFDLNARAVADLVEAGATAAPDLAAMGAACDVVFLCLPRSENVRAALFDHGLADALRPGATVIDQTSGDPTETRAMAETLSARGIHMIDAPVSGGAKEAEAGTIAIMIGGAADRIAAVQPIFDRISPNSYLCGAIGAGQVMKLINNTISTCNRFAMLEGVALGMRNGLDLGVMSDVLNAGGARSKATEAMLPALADGVPDSFFYLNLMLKDVNLATQLATQSGVPLQFGQLARGMMQAASNRLGPQANLFDIGDHVAPEAGTAFPARK